jgi:hypothetical protein
MDFFDALDANLPTPSAVYPPPVPDTDPRPLLERLQTGWRFVGDLDADHHRRTYTGRIDAVELSWDGRRYLWIERTRTRQGEVVSEVRWRLDRPAMVDRLGQRPDVAVAAARAACGRSGDPSGERPVEAGGRGPTQ